MVSSDSPKGPREQPEVTMTENQAKAGRSAEKKHDELPPLVQPEGQDQADAQGG